MLNILIGKENKPDDLVRDADAYIHKVGISDTDINRYLLEKLEQASYLNISEFIDRYGYKLPLSCLSTGMKILLEVINSDKCIYGLELGQNAFELLIQSANGTIYFDNVDRFELPEYFNLEDVSVNGEVFNTILELENALWKE